MKILIALLITLVISAASLAQTTEFTYQGKLTDGSVPASGVYTMRFDLFAGSSGGTALATQTIAAVQVTNGIFTASLDFGGGVFDGSNRYLEITVGSTTLSPRQLITSAPYSVQSLNATNAAQLGGFPANQYVVTTDTRLSDARPPTSGSPDYVQNRTTQQGTSNFNVSGNGTIGGTLSANLVNATQYNISGSRAFIVAGGGGHPGPSNTFAGRDSGNANTGAFNSFFGVNAGLSHQSGFENSFFGYNSGRESTSGGSNTFLGSNSGTSNTIENNNTFIGHRANGAAGITNATAIGFRASVTQSNSLVLGSIIGINPTTADTNVGIGTTAPLAKLHVQGGGIRVVGGPIFIAQPSSLIITSPNGNCWFITVSDTGVVSSFNVTCP